MGLCAEVIEKFSNRLSTARRRAGLSQAELASKIGRSRAAVARWESAKIRESPSFVDMVGVAEILGTNAGWLVGIMEDPQEPQFLNQEEMEMLELYRSMPPAIALAAIVFMRDHVQALQRVIELTGGG